MRPPTYAALRKALHAKHADLLAPHEETNESR
jgi:hypothetical protein